MASRDPWIKFYPDDWNSDIALASCSLAAQGLLARLIAVMHRSEPYGYLLCNGSEPRPADIARALGIAPNTYNACLRELLEKGVLKRDERGIYSKRMVLDQQKREQARKHGVKGGNPALMRKGLTPTLNHEDNPTIKIEKEKEKEKEAEAETRAHARLDRAAAASKINETHPYDPAVPREVVDEINRSWGPARLTGTLLDRIHRELDAGFPAEWMVRAIEEAADHGACNWAYLRSIISNWRDNGGPRTKEDAEAQARQAEEDARRRRLEEEARARERQRLMEEARARDPAWQEYDRAVASINRRRSEALRQRLSGQITVEELESITAGLEEEAQRLRPPPEPELEEVGNER
jgi:DnaD/phage-associated family protein